MILGLPELTVSLVLTALRVTRGLLELTENRVLMVLKAILGLLGRMARRHMRWPWQMDLLAMRRRGWPALSGQRVQLGRRVLLQQ